MISKDEFCELIKQYEKSIYYVAYSVVKNDMDAEEVIAQAILNAFEKRSTLNNKDSFKVWMSRVVHNTAVDYVRKNSKYIVCDELIDEEIESHDDEVVDRIAVLQAINKLNEKYRKILILYYYEGLDAKEIAYIVGSSSIAVRKQLSRARKMLKELLDWRDIDE